MTRYFQMRDDVYVPGRWYLTDPVDRHGRDLWRVFMRGRPVEVEGPVKVSFSKHAKSRGPIDYSELTMDIVPVVNIRVASIFLQLAPSDVQLFPIEIEGQPDQFCIVNVTKTIKCIDDRKSEEARHYTPDCEEEFRDRIGEYRSVIGMRIDPKKVGDAKIFRPWGWLVAIIVSEDVKQALEQIGTAGVRFKEV